MGYGAWVGPGSKFRVYQGYESATAWGNGTRVVRRRHIEVSVPSGGSGFRGTNVSTNYNGTVSLYKSTAGTTTANRLCVYGESIVDGYIWAQYTGGSGTTYHSATDGGANITYSVSNPTYTVTYNANGGSVSPTSATFTYGNAISLPTPTRTGYTFTRWHTNGNNTINLARKYMYTNKFSVHFEAYHSNWSQVANERLISCTEGGGWNIESWNNAPSFIAYSGGYKYAYGSLTWANMAAGWHTFDLIFTGSAITIYIDGTQRGTASCGTIGYNTWNSLWFGAEASDQGATAHGYAFTGSLANLRIANNTTRVSSNNTFQSPAQNFTLYAEWQANTYTVTYNANGGTGAPSAQSYTYASSGTITLSSTKPTRSGYTFMGWGTSATDTSADWSAGGTYNRNYAGNRTLYAIWRKTIKITYNANGGGTAPSANSGNIYNATTSRSVTMPSMTRTGYTLLGWSTSSSATSASYSVGTAYSFSDSTTLYAVWSENKLTVNYYSNYATEFNGNVTPKNEVNNNNVLIWSQYYYYDNAYSSGLINYTSGSDLGMTRTGYIATGYWGTSTDGGTLIHMNTGFDTGQALAQAFGKDLSSGNASVNVYAQWQKINNITMSFNSPTYTITNDTNGKAVLSNLDFTYTLSGVDTGNSSENFWFTPYYDQGSLTKRGPIAINSLTNNSGILTLTTAEIKDYLQKSYKTDKIEMNVNVWTSVEDNNNYKTISNLSLIIDNYAKPQCEILTAHRNTDESIAVSTQVVYSPGYTNLSAARPTLFWGETELSVTPTVEKISENVYKYEYIIPAASAPGANNVSLYFSDNIFSSTAKKRVAATHTDQLFKMVKTTGICYAFELIEK